MIRVVVFCEAEADFRTVSGLIDRMFVEKGPTWLRDLHETSPEATREWVEDSSQKRPFFDIHHVKKDTRRLGVRVPYGHFNGQPSAAGALMARNAFLITRALARNGSAIDALVLVSDMDDQGEERRRGLEQARNEALPWAPFRILLGSPDRMREAWVLAGFDPTSKDEEKRLKTERQTLGFCPCAEAHRLDAKDEQAKKNPKRVLAALTNGDYAREERCWKEALLETLRKRGVKSGLLSFLDEVTKTLLPLYDKVPGK